MYISLCFGEDAITSITIGVVGVWYMGDELFS